MTILATVYDINPYKGSESGTGWNLVKQISKYNKVIAITHSYFSFIENILSIIYA